MFPKALLDRFPSRNTGEYRSQALLNHLRGGRQGTALHPAKWRGRHFANFGMDTSHFAKFNFPSSYSRLVKWRPRHFTSLGPGAGPCPAARRAGDLIKFACSRRSARPLPALTLTVAIAKNNFPFLTLPM